MNPLLIPLEGAGARAWIVGAVALAIFTLMMFALLLFGKGREHS